MKTNKDKEYSFIHVNGRLDERYGVEISMIEFERLGEKFASDKSTRVLIESDEQEIHQERFKGKLIAFVFNTKLGYIKTALNNFDRRKR